MAGQGKYTRYVPVDPPAPLSTGGSSPPSLGTHSWSVSRLLFKMGIDLTNPPDIMARANKFLTPPKQDADPILFPKGVYLNFQNPDPAYSSPDVKSIDVSSMGPGGPANPWSPNQGSPDPSGGGSVAPVPAVLRAATDVQPNVQIGQNGTVDPADTSKDMFDGSQLPSALTLGTHPQK